MSEEAIKPKRGPVARAKAVTDTAPLAANEVAYSAIYFDRPRRIGNSTTSAVAALPGKPLVRVTEGSYVFFRCVTPRGVVEVPAHAVASAIPVEL